MTEDELRRKVDDIIHMGEHVDAEQGHGDEDDLHLTLIREFCPDWVVAEIDRLHASNFPRWCA